jgi:hypothetical protein
MTNPGNFIASYETTVYSARGDIQTLVISLILAVKGIAHDWYMSLKPLSVHSWHQIKAELLATFQGYRLEMKTTRDLMNCVQQDDEALSNYLKRFIQLKGHALNVPEAVVIAAAIEGLAMGDCVAHFARKPPAIVKELFEVMNRYARSDDDYSRRKAACSPLRQASMQ